MLEFIVGSFGAVQLRFICKDGKERRAVFGISQAISAEEDELVYKK